MPPRTTISHSRTMLRMRTAIDACRATATAGGLVASVLSAALALAVLPAPALALANPASVFCEQHGGKVEIQTIANGSQKGVCVFPDGARIDEWVYFRNKHRTAK